MMLAQDGVYAIHIKRRDGWTLHRTDRFLPRFTGRELLEVTGDYTSEHRFRPVGGDEDDDLTIERTTKRIESMRGIVGFEQVAAAMLLGFKNIVWGPNNHPVEVHDESVPEGYMWTE